MDVIQHEQACEGSGRCSASRSGDQRTLPAESGAARGNCRGKIDKLQQGTTTIDIH